MSITNDGGGGAVKSKSEVATLSAANIRGIAGRITQKSLRSADTRSTITANRGGQDAFGDGERAFSSLGVALISAANAIDAICGGWEEVDQHGEASMRNIGGQP